MDGYNFDIQTFSIDGHNFDIQTFSSAGSGDSRSGEITFFSTGI